RKRRRLTQIRYRQKLRDHADTLEQQVQARVPAPDPLSSGESPRIIADTTLWKVMAEYFRLFRFALTAYMYIPISERCNAPELQTLSGVIIKSGRGVDSLLERWSFISISQPNFEVEVVRFENGPRDCVVAITKTKIVLCESMLRYAFPNLAATERGKSLAAKMLGKRMEIDGCTMFGWDSENGQALSVDGKSDVLSPSSWLSQNESCRS
ncbi:hypothetical protein PHYSODRAFT_531231, partial [Phytophthora sojae]